MGMILEHRMLASAVAGAGFVAALLLAIAGTIAVRRALLEIPADLGEEALAAPAASPARGFLRTIAGLAVLTAGVLLLVLPGPGVLLMAAGLLMLGTRWQRGVVRACLARPRLLARVNALRARHGRPALTLEGLH